jgi:hypothetical protein
MPWATCRTLQVAQTAIYFANRIGDIVNEDRKAANEPEVPPLEAAAVTEE